MAQSTMARSPLGVHFFWDKSHQPELDWEKWLVTVKLAINNGLRKHPGGQITPT